MRVSVIIPAMNEEKTIGEVVSSVIEKVDQVIVVNNGSTDGTRRIAEEGGAIVVDVEQPGYGRCCLAGVARAKGSDVYVFMDTDGADDPGDLQRLLEPIRKGEVQMVIGSRLRGDGNIETGALTLTQRFGNTLACHLMMLFWQSGFTDLGPFRAITAAGYEQLGMSSLTYGWTVQMQVRALKKRMTTTEVSVNYRVRKGGKSKVSGTVKGVVFAGSYILGVIFAELLHPRI